MLSDERLQDQYSSHDSVPWWLQPTIMSQIMTRNRRHAIPLDLDVSVAQQPRRVLVLHASAGAMTTLLIG